MSVAFSVLATEPVRIAILTIGLVAVKMVILFALTSIFRMHFADRMLFSILLGQTDEFAFVALQLARTEKAIATTQYDIMSVAMALSMITTPLLLLFDKVIAPRLDGRAAHYPADSFDEHRKIVVLGYGRFNQIVTRMLRVQGFKMILIDDDPMQIALVRRFGVKVFYGDASRLDLLYTAGI